MKQGLPEQNRVALPASSDLVRDNLQQLSSTVI